MPNYRQDFEDMTGGRQAREYKNATILGQEMANEHIDNLARQKQAQEMRASRDTQALDEARAVGQAEGLGMGSQTIDSMNQLGEVSQQAMMEAAVPYVQQVIQGLQQGASQEEAMAFIQQNAEPELHDTIMQMVSQEAQAIQQAEASGSQVPQEQVSGEAYPQQQASPITKSAEQILAETLGMGEQQQGM